jgi:general secretion pathway protein D
MKRNLRFRALTAFVMAFCLFGAPLTAFAKKGEKNFKKGLEYEAAQQWEKAAQEFTLALAALPSDTEYQLHYRRAVFNASQFLMQRGRALLDGKDYLGAYNAFRQAFAYDPVNELAESEMARAMRLYNEARENPGASADPNGQPKAGGVQVRPTAYRPEGRASGRDNTVPRAEELSNFEYNNQDLQWVISNLCERLGLNVIFDPDTFQRQKKNITMKLRNVTTGQVLDYIFLQEQLFFQKLSRRTILVAAQTRRAQYQQLVLRSFFLSNSKAEDVRGLIQQAIPPNQGRPSTIVLTDKDTNSLLVRDTAENIRLIEDIIRSLDKDRAEVVMDVQIYEVSKQDLQQIGNQINTGSIGGIRSSATLLGGLDRVAAAATGGASAAASLPVSFGAALVLPASSLSALQTKGNSRLLASTQIHAFNNEESQARIGQRVPVQTASSFPFGNFGNQQGQTGAGNVFNSGFPVIQYEPVGLTLKFTPIVYPNHDVQVKMNIESKDVAGAGTLTPTFTERTISGTARIQNNRTMLLASVAQNTQSDSRSGLPILSGLPIFGRLFTTPSKENRQVDIVIAVTPRVLRAPAITPADNELRESGTLQMPTNAYIADLLRDAEIEEAQIAANRQGAALTTQTASNIPADKPAGEKVTFVPAERPATANPADAPQFVIEVSKTEPAPPPAAPAMQPVSVPAQPAPQLNVQQATQQLVNGNATPVNASAPAKAPAKDKPDNRHAVVAAPLNAQDLVPAVKPADANGPAAAGAQLSLIITGTDELRVGMRQRVAVMMESDAPLNQALVALKFDPAKLKVLSLTPGDASAGARLLQDLDPAGKISVMVMSQSGATIKPSASVLFYLDVEALGAGANVMDFDRVGLRLMTADNRDAFARFAETGLTVKQ